MTDVLFYHLERARLDGVLPELLEKTLERGWRACVKCGSKESVTRLDEMLWTYTDESFLPHSAAGNPQEAGRQPIWITDSEDLLNNPDVLFLVDGAEAAADTLSGLTRCVTIFNGYDDVAVSNARVFWKAVKAAGHEATYWRQSSSGRWEKQG